MTEQPILLAEDLWTAAEKWAWQENLEGRTANFNAASPSLDPASQSGWTVDRELRPIFLITVLAQEPYRSAQLRLGLRITGAWIRGALNLQGLTLPQGLKLERCRFEDTVDLSEMRTDRQVSFANSAFAKTMTVTGARINGDLSFQGAHLPEFVIGQGARVESDLILTASVGVDVSGSCPIRQSTGQPVQFSSMRVSS